VSTPAKPKRLPIGIQTLSIIMEKEMVYVDKTPYVDQLANTGGMRYFLARPRRFGKSLFVDTLQQAYEGRRELFKGLHLYDNWDWDKPHPVLKFDFAGGTVRSRRELDAKIHSKIDQLSESFHININIDDVSDRFAKLILTLSEEFGRKVVLLIDEYDKPLLDNITDTTAAEEIRDGLKNFYSVIKEQDANLEMVFITGVSKFSKVSIFSGINNLEDLTLDPDYAALCGYTQAELEEYFAPHLEGVDKEELKRWYNGYNFLGEKVYNPFDILLFISKNKNYRNYWFETGTPGFIMDLFKKNRYFLPNLDNLEVGEEILSTFEIGQIQVETLLFQSGYLTIEKVETVMGQQVFTLGFPNFEVKTAFNRYLVTRYTDLTAERYRYEKGLYDSLTEGDLPALGETIRRLFSAIGYRNYTNNPLAEYEGYYASVLYAFFAAIDGEIIPEDISNRGQADLTVKLGNNMYVMEIKTAAKADPGAGDKPNPALAQIRKRAYADKYTGLPGKNVYEVGIIFDPEERNLAAFDWVKR
jgi:hypothetical protein